MEKNRRTVRETLGARREPTTNPTHIRHQARIKYGSSNMGHIGEGGGRGALSVLWHPCSPMTL